MDRRAGSQAPLSRPFRKDDLRETPRALPSKTTDIRMSVNSVGGMVRTASPKQQRYRDITRRGFTKSLFSVFEKTPHECFYRFNYEAYSIFVDVDSIIELFDRILGGKFAKTRNREHNLAYNDKSLGAMA